MSKWMLISEAWDLNEIAQKVGEALTALTLLKFIKIEGLNIEVNEADLKRKVVSVETILEALLEEVKYVSKAGLSPTPLVEAIQEEYGYSDLKRIKTKIEDVLKALEHLNKGTYLKRDFEEIERFLEGLANKAASRSSDLIWRAGRY
mgnify:CR=1 FL=1